MDKEPAAPIVARRVKGSLSHACVTPGCGGTYGSAMPKGQGGGRGLCKRCYNEANALVKRGVTSWQELEALRLALPKVGSYFEHVLRAARAERDGK